MIFLASSRMREHLSFTVPWIFQDLLVHKVQPRDRTHVKLGPAPWSEPSLMVFMSTCCKWSHSVRNNNNNGRGGAAPPAPPLLAGRWPAGGLERFAIRSPNLNDNNNNNNNRMMLGGGAPAPPPPPPFASAFGLVRRSSASPFGRLILILLLIIILI